MLCIRSDYFFVDKVVNETSLPYIVTPSLVVAKALI